MKGAGSGASVIKSILIPIKKNKTGLFYFLSSEDSSELCSTSESVNARGHGENHTVGQDGCWR